MAAGGASIVPGPRVGGFRVWGLEFTVYDLGLRASGLEFRAWGSGSGNYCD